MCFYKKNSHALYCSPYVNPLRPSIFTMCLFNWHFRPRLSLLLRNHAPDELAEFSERIGRKFLFFVEPLAEHLVPWSGIGISVTG